MNCTIKLSVCLNMLIVCLESFVFCRNQNMSEITYELPKLSVNTDGWGPSSLPEQFEDLPFALFSRDDSLGMIVELSGLSNMPKNGFMICCIFL